MGKWSYNFNILNLGTTSFMFQLLYPRGKSPWNPLDRRLSGTQRKSGRRAVEKNLLPLPGIEFLLSSL
jgi:hypothetical protein